MTALRSPPDSRITGALSPVITDSSTVAMPSMTSPSPGNHVAGFAEHHVAGAQLRGRHLLDLAVRTVRFCATVSVLVLRSASACALPRASAIASAKLANSTVNQSHRAICTPNPMSAGARDDIADRRTPSSERRPPRRRTSPDSSISVIGFSLTNESLDRPPQDLRIEQRTRPGSFFGAERVRRASWLDCGGLRIYVGSRVVAILKQPSRSCIRKCSTIGPSDSAGKNVSAPTMTTVPTSRPTNSGPCVGKRAARDRNRFLRREAAGDGQQRNDEQESADQHRQADASGCTRACSR